MICAGVCSGISAPAVAWESLGWEWAFESEIEPFPSAVLHHHRPDVPNYGDMNDYRNWPDADLDILIGGTPCQSFSVAGLRQGMDDPRGNLALVFIGLVDKYRPRWVVWENVPGVLSSSEGRDFESFIRGMAEIGYFGAWRVLDAQWFGVAQRRRRVFAIFCPGDWQPAAAVLFEPESLRGDSAPSREAGEGITNALTERADRGGTNSAGQRLIPEVCGTLSDGAHMGGGLNGQDAYSGRIIPVAHTLLGKANCSHAADKETYVAHTLKGEGFDASEDGTGRGTPLVPVAYNITPSNSNKDYNARPAKYAQAVTTQAGSAPSARGGDVVAFSCKDHGADAGDLAPTLRSMNNANSSPNGGGQVAIGFIPKAPPNSRSMGEAAEQSPTVTTHQLGQGVQQDMAVRRLTPRECERLQGFPDDYTLIPVRPVPAKSQDKQRARMESGDERFTEADGLIWYQSADGPRYKALGNSMAVPVVRWIGERIAMLEGAAA